MAYLTHRRRRAAAPYRSFTISDFGGLKSLYGPLVRARNALRSENCNYDSRRIAKALGDVPFLENAVGATQIDTFESAVGWSAGAQDTTAGNFVVIEAGATGTQSRSLSQVGVGTATMEKTVTLDLGIGIRDIIHVWTKPLALPSTVTEYEVRLRLQTSAGNYFETILYGVNVPAVSGQESLELDSNGVGIGRYTRVRRNLFVETGNADWANITLIHLAVQIIAGTGTMTVAFDNLYRSGGFIQDLFQYRRLTGVQAQAKEEFAINIGVAYKSDGQRWVTAGYSAFNADAQIHSITSQDRRFLTDGLTTPQKIMPDGTFYRMGIVGPVKQIALATDETGGFTDQGFWVVITYYSTITGLESAPDEKSPGTKITLSSTTSTQAVLVSNIPTSTDPQVTHVRIYIRPENLADEQFFRASGDPDGEVTNGTGTFEITIAESDVTNFEVLDPDLDYLSYVDLDDQPADIDGTVVSATASTAILDSSAPSASDNLNGRELKIVGGTGIDQTRRISEYRGTTRTATLSSDWSTNPDSTSTYKVVAPRGVVKEGHALFFAEHAGYMLTVLKEAPTIARFSRFRKPENWRLSSEIPLGENDNDGITGLHSARNVALAFKKDAVFPIRSVGEPIGLVAEESISERGTQSQKSITKIHEQIWWQNEDGIFWFDSGLGVHRASAEAQPTWENLWDRKRLNLSVGVELRNRFQYFLFGPKLGDFYNSRAWVTNSRRQEGVAFDREPDYDPSVHSYGADAAAAIEDALDIHRTLIARDALIFQIDSGAERDGRGFKMIHRTGIWSPNKGQWVCRWPWTGILSHVAGTQNLKVRVFIGGVLTTDGTPEADLSGQSDPFGQFVLGTSKLGSGPYAYQQINNPPKTGRYVQYEFEHDGRAFIDIQSITVWYSLRTQRGHF